ncbi:MAG TPA: hypothetical protein VK752_21710 [Bryobacteraceae bacterium]|jgi:hypothetical protein|nr:hypothetical protein [Bryobacteraceae bacterium]
MTSIYTKLTPTKRGVFGYSRLWLAPDHILLLISSQLAEDYKRFSFSDIQSIVVTELPSRLVPQVIMILAALAWMSLWFAVDIAFFKWMFAVTGAAALLWSIRDIARGQRCRCYLHTRVSKELLAPVARVKIARQFLAVVRPRIEAVQGTLSMQQLDTMETPYVPLETEPPKIASSPGYVPEVLFAIFLINAALIWAEVRFPKVPEIPGVLINSLLAEALLIVVALVRRRGRDPRVIIYVVIALSILGLGFDLVTISRQLFSWYMNVLDKTKNGDKSTTFVYLFSSAGRGAVIASSWRAVAGVAGLAASFYERRKKR